MPFLQPFACFASRLPLPLSLSFSVAPISKICFSLKTTCGENLSFFENFMFWSYLPLLNSSKNYSLFPQTPNFLLTLFLSWESLLSAADLFSDMQPSLRYGWSTKSCPCKDDRRTLSQQLSVAIAPLLEVGLWVNLSLLHLYSVWFVYAVTAAMSIWKTVTL